MLENAADQRRQLHDAVGHDPRSSFALVRSKREDTRAANCLQGVDVSVQVCQRLIDLFREP